MAVKRTCPACVIDDKLVGPVVKVGKDLWVVTWRWRWTGEGCQISTRQLDGKRETGQFRVLDAPSPILAWRRWTCYYRGGEMGRRAVRGKVGMKRLHWRIAIGVHTNVEEREEASGGYQKPRGLMNLAILRRWSLVSRCHPNDSSAWARVKAKTKKNKSQKESPRRAMRMSWRPLRSTQRGCSEPAWRTIAMAITLTGVHGAAATALGQTTPIARGRVAHFVLTRLEPCSQECSKMMN